MASTSAGSRRCASRAGFGTPHYVALRMALDLAEQGVKGGASEHGYPDDAIRFIQEQYERIKGDADQVGQWFRH